MIRPIAIIAGEPNSISSEIIFKNWQLNKNKSNKKFFIIGSLDLLEKQKRKLKYKIKFKKINNDFKSKDFSSNKIPIFNVNYNQNKAFEKISDKSNKYIIKCFDQAIEFIKKKKVVGIINCPISKEYLFKKKHQGITEFLAKKIGKKGDEVMLIYNKELAVSPITTHIPLSLVSKKVNKKKIIKNVFTINSFYIKNFKKKPKFAVLGLNPHNYSFKKKTEETEIIAAIKKLKRLKIKVIGPVPTDSSFMMRNKYKFDVVIGMYHDQVLTPFKALYKFNAINITLGLPFIRVSPDHGVGTNIIGKKKADEKSLSESIKFLSSLK